MERKVRDLESLVSSQKEQLSRYEKRLKDVVTAYKGLLKEKEALETSLAALQHATSSSPLENSSQQPKPSTSHDMQSSVHTDEVDADGIDAENFQTQIRTLMNSLATLSAEKSRMEASFQADKKQLRAQLAQKDQIVGEIKAKMKEVEERGKSEVDEMKAKWIIERQEREKETNNQMLMIRELQKLYADERHLKENIEMQLNNFKTQFANNETGESARVRELQAQLKEAKAQLKQWQVKNKNSTDQGDISNGDALSQVRQEMHTLKEQHAIAIKNEQKRALLAEEQSKKQAALHEDRVANLEARLAELSSAVGSYDRLRQQDQNSIQSLKRRLQELERHSDSPEGEGDNGVLTRKLSQEGEGASGQSIINMADIVDEIMRLKKILVAENARSSNPIDLSKLFMVGGGDHAQCQQDIERFQQKAEESKSEVKRLLDKVQQQQKHIHTLQEKVQVLNMNIDEQEQELKQQAEKLSAAVKEEREKWQCTLAEKENELRSKVNDLELQLQKQRQRSLQLLEEKEQEIKALQTSFEVFHQMPPPMTSSSMASNDLNPATATSSDNDNESNDNASTSAGAKNQNPHPKRKSSLKSKKLSVGDNCHMLHYANEIARKDIEIAGLRKSKYAAETALRKAIQDKVSAQEELADKIDQLEEQVDRLERCKTREGANLEYLKNVIISYILTKDAEGKRHMLNAISAVLQFTPGEMQTINAAAFHKK